MTANFNEELGLLSPTSRISCFILYLNSLELGVPPLYAEANKIIREADISKLTNLGPFIKALA